MIGEIVGKSYDEKIISQNCLDYCGEKYNLAADLIKHAIRTRFKTVAPEARPHPDGGG
jgi:hypothetical protein